MNNFELRPADHTYLLEGNKLLSNTEIIKLCGLIDDDWYTNASRARGTAVHAACHYLAEGDLDRSSLVPTLAGYVAAYEKAIAELGVKKLMEAERPIYHPNFLYGTTLDQLWDDNIIVELKSGTMMAWTAIQTALQAMARFPTNYFRVKRFGVQLSADGKKKIEEFKDVNDFNAGIGMIASANWIKKHGGKYA